MASLKLLDCTLRDGGYYTNWNFDNQLVRDLVHALDFAKVDIIELGYKSPKKGGLYRKCNDRFIWEVLESTLPVNSSLAFMIDAKDFISENGVDLSLLEDTIHESTGSPFSVCRLAIKYGELNHALEIAEYVKSKGYRLIVNIMAASLLTEKELADLKILANIKVEALYFADSFGNLTPGDVEYLVKEFLVLGIEVGLHAHDNLGLAFANCLAAWSTGASYLDGTLLGMGRGVGNTKTEQLITYLENQKLDFISRPITRFVYKWMKPLKERYKWGFTHNYLISGLQHIHPLYVQNLQATFLNPSQIENIIGGLKNPLVFEPSQIENLVKPKVAVIIPARFKSSRFPGKPLAKIKGKEMIIWVAEIAQKAVGIDNVYIATENEEIVKVVKSYGFKVILTSDDCLTGTDRVAQASLEVDADIIVNIQGDEPMLNPSDILKVIETKLTYPNHVVNCYSFLDSTEDVSNRKIPKIVTNLYNELIYSSRNPIPGTKIGNSSKSKKQVCIYAFTRDELAEFTKGGTKTPLEFEEDIEILRFIEKGIKVKMIELSSKTYAVDYPEDIEVVEKIL